MSHSDNKHQLQTEDEIRLQRKNMTYTQRFDLLMKLIRLQRSLKSAKIIKP